MPNYLGQAPSGLHRFQMDDGREELFPDTDFVRANIPPAPSAPASAPPPAAPVAPVEPGGGAAGKVFGTMTAPEPAPAEDSFFAQPPESDLEAKLRSGAVTEDLIFGGLISDKVPLEEVEQLARRGLVDKDRLARFKESKQKLADKQAQPETAPQPKPNMQYRGDREAQMAQQAKGAQGPQGPMLPGVQRFSSKPYMDALEGEKDAIEAQKEVMDTAIQAENEVRQKRQAVRLEQAAEQEALHQRYQSEMATQEARVREAMDAVVERRVNPDQFWEDRGTAGRIKAGIAVMLSAAGQGLAGGENMAMRTIQTGIDREIEAQKIALAGAQRSVADERGMLGVIRSKFHDRTQQLAAAQSLAWDAVTEELEAVRSQTQNQLKLQALDSLQAQIDGRKAEAGFQVQNANNQLALQAMAAYGKQLSGQKDALEAEQKAKELWVPGVGFATNVDGRKVLQKQKVSKDQVDALIDELLTLSRSTKLQEGGQIGEATVTALQLKLKNLEELGVLAGPDMDLLRAMTGDPSKLTQVGAVTRLNTLKKNTQLSWDAVKNVYLDPTRGTGPMAPSQMTEEQVAAQFGRR